MKRGLTILLILSIGSLYSQGVKDSLNNNKEKTVGEVVITGTMKEVRKAVYLQYMVSAGYQIV